MKQIQYNNKIIFSVSLIILFFSVTFLIKAQEVVPKRTERIPLSGTILLQPDATEYISYWNSDARFPTYAGKAGNILMSNGKDWKSVAGNITGGVDLINEGIGTNIKTFLTRPLLATGALMSIQLDSQVKSNVGLFNLPANILINKISYTVSSSDTAGKYKICIYDESGTNKILDIESLPVVGANTVALDSSVSLSAGNYYVAMGCGSVSCNNTVVSFVSSSSNIFNGVNVPDGAEIYEGTVEHESGVCADTLGIITPGSSKTPVIRLDE